MENISYDILITDSHVDRDRLDELVDIMLETVCTARATVRIAGDDYPAELVKAKFMKLDSEHIRFVLLHDDKDVDVKLSSDSEIGSRLLRVSSKNDTLADANTVAFAVSTAREEILPELEQNIVHNQYLTKEMLLDDGDEYICVNGSFMTAYQDQIEQAIVDKQAPEIKVFFAGGLEV